ncbi:cupin domain-containing protein [Mangrovimonas aestuarii]|uniref:cupin domain-containing protein n=1 Tax=Mangrovimonas aestuarii TaxID=3018443 RepID=UPI00237841EF|nr:cupin domain-containing protein [Mangrovimonas aestuarii]
MNQAEQLIKALNLAPHPEGGYYKETHRSEGLITESSLPDFEGDRNYSTCIYFLLTSDQISAFHKIKQDEIWHFYQGSPIVLHTISEDGDHKEYLIGSDIINGQTPQLIVPNNHWFAAKLFNPDDYALVGCTVSPGFDFRDFILPSRQELLYKFPQHKELVVEFTKD